MDRKMLKEMYTNSTAGRWALYFMAAAFAFLIAHYFWLRPPPLSELTVVRGVLLSAKHMDESLSVWSNWTNYKLEFKDEKGERILLSYFDDTSDSSVATGKSSAFAGPLKKFQGKNLVAWADMQNFLHPIYQLTADGDSLVDYKTRVAQVMGQPVYALLCFSAFLILSVRRYLLISHNRRYLLSRQLLKEETK